MLGAIISAGIGAASSFLGAKSAEKTAESNIDYQKEFAQTGIQWKVEDAKKAGIHPLYALGASTPTFQPVNSSAPEHIARMGQNLGRAAEAVIPSTQRQLARTTAQLQIESLGLDNEIKKQKIASEIALRNQAISQPSGPNVVEVPANVTMAHDAHSRQVEAGQPPAIKYNRVKGGLVATLSEGVKQVVEDSPQEWLMQATEFGPQYFGSNRNKPPLSLVRKHWPMATDSYFDRSEGAWKPIFSARPSHKVNKRDNRRYEHFILDAPSP